MFEISLADLQGDEDQAYRKIRLRAEDVQGRNVLTNFWVIIYFIFIDLKLSYKMKQSKIVFSRIRNICYFHSVVDVSGNGFHYWQTKVSGEEVANTHWGSRGCENNWQLHLEDVLHWIYKEASQPG